MLGLVHVEPRVMPRDGLTCLVEITFLRVFGKQENFVCRYLCPVDENSIANLMNAGTDDLVSILRVATSTLLRRDSSGIELC